MKNPKSMRELAAEASSRGQDWQPYFRPLNTLCGMLIQYGLAMIAENRERSLFRVWFDIEPLGKNTWAYESLRPLDTARIRRGALRNE